MFPEYQFGFRYKRSTVGAASLLYSIANDRLKQGKRTYVAFIDFKKTFDLIPRRNLFEKLLVLGFPRGVCVLFSNIFNSLKSKIMNGDEQSQVFYSSRGLPQGDCASPVLFNLFVADLPGSLLDEGPIWRGRRINYIQYADDLVLISENPTFLQRQIDALSTYCSENRLDVNTVKSKILIFHKGPKVFLNLKKVNLKL